MKITVIILLTLFLLNTYAQDSPQWHLPDGAKMRLGKGVINEIQYSPDGTRLAVASSIGIWIYATATGQEVALLTGHTSAVLSVAFSPDGRTLASGSRDSYHPSVGCEHGRAPAHPHGAYFGCLKRGVQSG